MFQLLVTLLWEQGSGIFLLDEHMQRLAKSAAYFDVPLDIYAIQEKLEQVCGDVPQKIRLLLDRNGMFEVQAVPERTDRRSVPAVVVALAKAPVDSQDIFLFHKTTHRAVYESAKADFPECDEVILWNEHGEVTEGTIANLVIRREGTLITPPVGCGLLAGTFREHLLKAGEIEEGILSIEELRAADEIFLLNSVRKWRRANFLECGGH